MISKVAAIVAALHPHRIARVAVDGIDGAGKTVFADELAEAIEPLGRLPIRASVDGFHRPRKVRYHRGRGSPEAYFQDSYDYALLREVLLDPLSPGGPGRYRTAVFDFRTDRPVEPVWHHAPAGAVLIFDGIFLHRPELRSYWDYSIFLDVAFDVSIPRCAQRDGSDPDPAAPANRRYVEGQRLYLDHCHPRDHASTVIDNNNLDEPRSTRP